ncbi:MAG TPA: type IV pilus assembly protein PilM [Vicinamibacterales bacterium]|nr:type IV pilus assembly protein PilM [Vicinamibacterales bacterium]
MVLSSAFRTQTVGLDIGSSAVRGVVLKRGRGSWSLVAAGEEPLPDNCIQDGATLEPAMVSGAVTRLIDSFRLKKARVASALSGHSVIVKRIWLPTVEESELDNRIPWEAEQHIPFDLSEVQLDYRVVSTGTNSSKGGVDVLVVAAKKDRIEERTMVIEHSGRTPAVVDVEAFALANAYQMNYPDRTDALTALIHVGRSGTIVCLLERGDPVLSRHIPIGGQGHVEALMREGGPDVNEGTAREMLRGRMSKRVNEKKVNAVLREASAQLVAEIRTTIDFYRESDRAGQLGRIAVSGGAWQMAGLFDLLKTELGADVQVFDPFRQVSNAGQVGNETTGPAYAVAVGLAMRQDDDR